MEHEPDLIKSYPDDALLEELRRAAELVEEPVLTKVHFTKHTGIAADTLARRFGGWGMALERAGLSHRLDPSDDVPRRARRPRLSDEELLEELRRVAGLVGKPVLTKTDFNVHSRYSAHTLYKRFGGWRLILERAGLGHMYLGETARDRAARYSDDDLVQELCRVAELVGKPELTMADFDQHARLTAVHVSRRFGGWRAALERAGLGHLSATRSGDHVKRSDEELLEKIRQVAKLVGKPVLTRNDFVKHSGIGRNTISLRFGGWHAALERAGLVYADKAEYSDAELLDRIRRAAEIIGKPVLTRLAFKECTGISHKVVIRRFGSWRIALERAGIADVCSRSCCRHTDAELLEEVRRAAGLTDKPVLTMVDFNRYSKVAPDTITRRLGGWRVALECAGVGHMFSLAREAHPDHSRARYSDKELLEEVRRVAGLVGRPVLTQDDFNKYSKIDVDTLTQRFGNWRTALERAGVGDMCLVANKELARICRGGYSDAAMLAEVQRVAKLVGDPVLRYSDFSKHSKIHANTLRARFGRWRAVLEHAGVGHMYSGEVGRAPCRPRYSDEDLLAEVRRVALLIEKSSFTQVDFRKYSAKGMGLKAVRRRFGDWHDVLKRAGVGHMYSGISVGRKRS